MQAIMLMKLNFGLNLDLCVCVYIYKSYIVLININLFTHHKQKIVYPSLLTRRRNIRCQLSEQAK